jgi:protein-disulfide isomerase
MTKEAKILIAIAIVVVIGGVLLAIFANPQPKDAGAPVDEQSLVRDNSHMTGKLGAKVTIVEFGDFQCPGCAAASPVVKQITEAYKDNEDVNFVFRNFPLDTIHPNAHIAAEAAEAAGAQDKYWEMHHLLYEKQNEWSTNANPIETFVGYAQSLGLNTDTFRQAVSQRLYAEIIKTDFADGQAVGVNSTPTFFFNGVKEAKILSFEEFKAKIDAELAKDGSEPAAATGEQTQTDGQPVQEEPAPVPAQ